MTLEVVSPTSVVLSWYPPRLEYWNGVVVNYTVEINLIGPAGSPNEGIAFTEFHSIPLPGHPLTNNLDPRLAVLPLQPEAYQANMLHEFHVYSFIMYMYNAAGRSNPSLTIFQEMPGTGITLQITFKVLISCVIISFSVPTGSPTNIQVRLLSSTSVIISWGPPDILHQNAPITGYILHLINQ